MKGLRLALAALVLASLLGACQGGADRRFDYEREMDGCAHGCDSGLAPERSPWRGA